LSLGVFCTLFDILFDFAGFTLCVFDAFGDFSADFLGFDLGILLCDVGLLAVVVLARGALHRVL
jgi:hypothetical protein